MTPKEIRARCRQFISDMYGKEDYPRTEQALVESLCHEMIAVGLERAAVRLMGWREEDPPEDVSIDVWKYFGRERERLANDLRAEAQKLKEPHDKAS